MNKRFFLILSVLAAAIAVILVSAKPPTQPICPIQSDTNVVFYGETGFGGVGTLSRSWLTHFLDWWKAQDPSIKYVILDSSDVKTDCNLANYPKVKVYIQPGGDAYYQQRKLGTAGKTNINNYINSGKGYVGICAGFYYTAGDYYWQGSYYNWPDLLGKYSTVEGSITDIADYDENPGYALTNVGGFDMIYYGGPTIGWRQTPSDYPGQALLTYNAIPGNLPAAIKDNNMLLMSVHAEAYENDGITGLSTEQRIENYKWLANAINSAAGTNFSVPDYTNPPVCGNGVCESGEDWYSCPADCPVPACSDRIDNDGDTLIDFPNDTGCSSTIDNDETDVIGPTEIFFDGFENGISGWTLSHASGANDWTVSTANPYFGSYHANVNPADTDNPASSLERTISTVDHSNIKFSYYRKLVLPTDLKMFKAKWFDGTTWRVLESTVHVSDTGYLYKEFDLPPSANNNPNFRIKFECTSGAINDYCRVDNVKLTAN